MKELQQKWDESLEFLRNDVTPTAMETWFEPLRPVKFEKREKRLFIEADTSFVVDRVNDRYLQLLRGAVSAAFALPDVTVIASVAQKAKTPLPKFEEEDDDIEPINLKEENYLNPRYNFGNFVVGSNSNLAYHAALAVAEAPASHLNPFFLYGSSGVGKTHLLHAIGHYILKNSDKKVLYVSSETFTNDFINSLRKNNAPLFKKKYRKVDVLLIDDIQFIEGKQSTQDEFFHTFNALYDNNAQIILSSDRPPQQLGGLDERLKSRFMWSMIADIQPPDYETRVAILTNIAKRDNIPINGDSLSVINLIAEKSKYNVREMEGFMTRLIFFSTQANRPINMSLAKEVLKDLESSSDYRYNIPSIKRAVSRYYGISQKELESPGRSRNIAFPRQVAMYLIKELTDTSLPKIGESFGGRDHTTVLHAHKKIKEDIKNDSSLKTQINEIKATLEK